MIGLVFYFTATGNSLYAARQLDGECYSIPRELHGDMHYSSAEIGIVCPVYGHEMPLPVKRFIAEADFETDYLYLILTYGNRHGGVAELAAEFAGSVGKTFRYINVLLMADNFLPAFDMSRQMKLDKHIPQQQRLHILHGVYPRLPRNGDTADGIRTESECSVSERKCQFYGYNNCQQAKIIKEEVYYGICITQHRSKNAAGRLRSISDTRCRTVRTGGI